MTPQTVNGEYLVFVRDLSELEPDQLRHQVAYLDAHPDRSFQSWLGAPNESGVPDEDRYRAAESLIVQLLHRGIAPPPTVMVRRRLLKHLDNTEAGEGSVDVLRLHLSSELSYPMLGPERVQIGPIDACNARCLFCRDHSPLIDHHGERLTGMLDWNIWRQCLDDVIAMKTRRVDYIGIGEPLMHPRIAEALRYGSQHLSQYMVTNGLLLHRHLDTIAEHVDWLSVSLNAVTAKTQHALHLTGEAGFVATVNAIRALVARRQRRGQVSISFVVNRQNFREVADLPTFCEDLGVSVWLNPVGVYDETREPLGLSSDEQRELDDILARLAEMPDHRIRNLPEFRDFEGRDTTHVVTQIPCYVGLVFAQIRGDGSVSHCCACDHTPVGNINEQTFAEIWTSQKYRRFRRDALFTIVQTQQSLPGCHCDICGLAAESVGVHNRLHGTNHTMASLKVSGGARPRMSAQVSPLILHRKTA